MRTVTDRETIAGLFTAIIALAEELTDETLIVPLNRGRRDRY